MQGTSLYLPLDTAIHRLHPVAKVLGLLILFVPALAFNDPIWLGTLLLCSILLLLGAGGGENLRRMGSFLLVLFVMASLMWSLFMVDLKEPHVLLVLGPVTISRESLLYGVAMGCRVSSLLIVGLCFITTTRPEEFTYALRRLGAPAPLTLALSLSFRLLPTFAGTVATVKDAQQARGLELGSGGPIRRMRNYISLVAPAFGYALRQADDLSRALEARGVMSTGVKTEFRVFMVRWVDWLTVVGLVLVAAGSVWLRMLGYGELLERM